MSVVWWSLLSLKSSQFKFNTVSLVWKREMINIFPFCMQLKFFFSLFRIFQSQHYFLSNIIWTFSWAVLPLSKGGFLQHIIWWCITYMLCYRYSFHCFCPEHLAVCIANIRFSFKWCGLALSIFRAGSLMRDHLFNDSVSCPSIPLKSTPWVLAVLVDIEECFDRPGPLPTPPNFMQKPTVCVFNNIRNIYLSSWWSYWTASEVKWLLTQWVKSSPQLVQAPLFAYLLACRWDTCGTKKSQSRTAEQWRGSYLVWGAGV